MIAPYLKQVPCHTIKTLKNKEIALDGKNRTALKCKMTGRKGGRVEKCNTVEGTGSAGCAMSESRYYRVSYAGSFNDSSTAASTKALAPHKQPLSPYC